MAGAVRPPTGELERRLPRLLPGGEGGGRPVAVLRRRPNPYESSFPSEIVECRVEGRDREVRLFVKYGTRSFDRAFGHRRGLRYEARVYRDVLGPLGVSVPRLYGPLRDATREPPWLVLEYLDGARRVSWMHTTRPLVNAAGWIGSFHRRSRRLARQGTFLRTYDERYYLPWVGRAERELRPLLGTEGWIRPVLHAAPSVLAELGRAPRSVVHGEYFGLNIVSQYGAIRPIDWQSAAVAPGEIDLAMLTHSWPPAVVRRCQRAYERARWPHGAPRRWARTFLAARLYTDLRWLGDPRLMKPDGRRAGPKRVAKHRARFLADLRAVGLRLGYLEPQEAR